ncbi:hypothetical protein CAPTEDRAFT_216413 [Capitella teleta]|uniref:PDZ domain-containing protein n=1 Tax=Capitella teleta TaxID=283909 RepID=R7TLB2_CAPTE|nr:hypothetical protein CAPTEDRAFT_216413 [Capitella teleta]|eukprot:ELT91890.1 hypothetical protein CAPTEDRAFT_216413 [Capitella teleta]
MLIECSMRKLLSFENNNHNEKCMMSQNYPPQQHSISTINEEYESGSDYSGAGHPRGGSSIRYIVTDPNDVQFIEQSKAYPTVNAAQGNSGFVNNAYEPDDGGQLSSAAAARAARRSRRRMRRQQELEATVSPDTSSDDVAPYLTPAGMDQQTEQQKKGIIKEKIKQHKLVQNGDLLEDGHKVFHLKKRGDGGYGFAYRNGKVSVVVPDSEADKVGLRVGDKIMEVNGVNIQGQDKDAILEKISRNRKNLILVVHDGNFTPSESSDLNESGSEFSDSVDRSSGSSVRFQIDGRMNPLKPGESVASLDTVPMRNVVNFDPNPKPKRSKRHHSNQRGVYPPPNNQSSRSGSLNRQQSPHRNSGRGSQRSRSRSPAHQNSRSRSPAHQSSRSRSPAHQSRHNGSLGRSSAPPSEMPVINSAPQHHSLYNNNKPAQMDVSAITVQPEKSRPLDTMDSHNPTPEQKTGICCGTYTMWAAFAMIFCLPCIPLGAMAYVYARKSTKAYHLQDSTLAEKFATTSGYFIIASIIFGLMAWLGLLVVVIFTTI